MSRHAIPRITGATLATLLLSFSAFAGEHQVLNGTWKLVPAKSEFAGQPVVQTGTVRISDDRGVIVITRSFVYDGATETTFYSDSTANSKNSPTIKAGNLKTKTKWDHDVLKVTTTQSGAVTQESYSLSPDGNMMVSVVRTAAKPINLTFERQ